MATKYCVRCGTALKPEKAFCSRCGHGVNAPPPSNDRYPEPLTDSAPPRRPRNVLRIAIALAALLVVVAAMATVWHYKASRKHLAAAAVSSSSPIQGTNPTTEVQPHPVLATVPSPSQFTPASPSPKITPSAQSAGHPPSPNPVNWKGGNGKLSNANAPPLPSPAPVAPARSGLLHYAGPSVAQGGVVVFSGLPAGRLRFTFNHQMWQSTISRRPDGTQTLMLRSLTPGPQTQCDVKWETIE
jgi:hypothetical protein